MEIIIYIYAKNTYRINEITKIQILTKFKQKIFQTIYVRIKHWAVAILPSTAFYPQRLLCCELFVIGQS